MNCPACGSELKFTETIAGAMDYYKCLTCEKTTDKCNWWNFHTPEVVR